MNLCHGLRKKVAAVNKWTQVTEESIWDSLPDEFPYGDEGCELAPSCLTCPFHCCIREEPWGKEKFLKRRRAERMLEQEKEGKSIKEISRIFGVSTRTVQRALKAIKEASEDRNQNAKRKSKF